MRRRGLAILLGLGLTFGVWPSIYPAPANAAVTDKLPDLAVLPPSEFKVIVRSDGTKRLRFTTIVVNLGPGPFAMYGYDEDGVAAIGDSLLVRQLISRSDGTVRERATTATMFWSGDGHNHFHAADLQLIRLEKLDGTEVKRTKKLGFCFLDSYRYGSTLPSVYNWDIQVCNPNPDGTVKMGISVRWGDTYRYSIAYQWIDITHVPNGDYKVKHVADPPFYAGGRFIEANETNNRGWTKIRLKGTSVTILSRSVRP
jgi:hypothetical protein